MSFFKKKQKEIKSKIKDNKFDSMDDLDFGDDDNWDLDDLDIDIVSKKRSPITRVGRGILKGIKGHALDFRNHRREVLKHFPDLVSDTIDQLEETANSLADEVRETARKSRPDLRRMSGTIDKLVPSKYGRIKKLTAKAVEKLSDESEETVSPERAREDTLSNTLADIFNANQASDTYNQKRSEAQSMISEKLAEGRHKQTTFQLGKIHESVALANAFNTKVTTAFQKKLLEIQFRSYYVQSDLLATYKAQSQESKILLAAIMKNTGLPDYVKMNESDRFKATARKELFDAAKEKFFSKNSYYKRIVEEGKNKLNSLNLSGISGSLEDLLQGQEVGMDFIEDGVAAIVSQGILPGLTSKYFKKALDKYIPKGSDKHNKVLDMIIKLQNPSKRGQEIADILEDWEYDPSLLKSLLGKGAAPLVDILRKAADAGSPKVNLKKTDEDLLAAAEFNKISQISLVKIIPGYLSRILQQSERIGNIEGLIYAQRESGKGNKVKDALKSAVPELLKYDPNDGEFLSESKMNERVSKMVDKHIDIEGRTRKLFELSKITLEGKDFITEKSNFRDEAKAQVKVMLKDLTDAKTAANGIKDNEAKKEYKLKIDELKNDIRKFKDEYMNSSISNSQFDYNGFMSLVADAKSIIENIHRELKETSSLGSLVSKTQNRETTLRTLANKIEARDKKIDSDQVRVLSQVFHIADAEGKGLEELPSLLKNKTFRDEIMVKYSISENDINKARSILNNSDFKNNKEVLASLVSEFNSYRERNNSATQVVNRQRELGTISKANLHKFGMQVSDDGTSMQDNQASVMRKIVNKSKILAKQSDLAFWQNEIKAQVTSPETKRKLNMLIRGLGPDDRMKVMEYLHRSGSGDIAKLENMINDMSVKYEDYNRRDRPGEIFTHLTSQSEIGDPNGSIPSVPSDPALKIKTGSMNKGVMKSWTPTADKLGNIKTDHTFAYKFDKDRNPYVGPMADDVQRQFGDAVAPGGKKINIGSMMGVLGTSVNELSYKMKHDTVSIANAIAYQTSQNSSWLVADLASKGLSGDSINKIFSDKSTSVDDIVKLTEQGFIKGAEAKAKIQEKVDEITEKVVDAKAKFSDKKQAAQEYIRGKYRAGLVFAGIQSGNLSDIKDAGVAKVHKANEYMGKISNAISANETLKGTFVDSAAKRLAEDMDEVVNAPDGETRAKALSDMFVTLISTGVEKVGQGGRFAYAKTVGKFIKKSVSVYNQYKSVHCMSDVYLGKTESDLETPVLESINYRTTDTSRMYVDSKTGIRITSACHVRGAVSRANGDVIFTNDDIKEHGLYVLDNEGKPVKLGGLKFMASTGMNAAARLAKFAVKKIWNNKATNKIKDLVKKKSKRLVDSRLGKGVRGSFLGRRTGDVRDIAHATYRTLLGDNQLLPTLTDKIERMRDHHFNMPGKGIFGKYGAMAADALTGTFDDSPDYYEPTGILRRKHESDMIKAQRHFENISSKIDTPLKAEKHYKKYASSMKSLNKRKMPEEEKKRLAHLLHIKYRGTVNPDIGPVDYKKLAYESATGKTQHKLSFRHPFRSAGRLGGMALRHPIRAGMIGAAGMALAPAALPLAGMAGAGYIGYRAIKHDVSGGGVGRRFARWKKPWTIPGAIAGTVLHPFKHPGNGDTYNPNHLPFDDTVINGDEKVRRGGIRDMLNKMKEKGKHHKDKFVNMIKNHKGAAMGAGMMGLGLLGSIGDIIGKSYDVLKGVWDTLKFIKGATKMLFKLPSLLGKLGGFLKRGIGKLGNLFRGGKTAATDVAEDATEDTAEAGAADAAEAGGAEAAEAGAAATAGEAGAATIGGATALGGVAIAGAAGYGVGTLINKYVLNKYVPGWKNGKLVHSLFNRSTAHIDMINSLKQYTNTMNMIMKNVKSGKGRETDKILSHQQALVGGNTFKYAIKHSANPVAAKYLKARSEFLALAAKTSKDDAVHTKKVVAAIIKHKPIPTAPGAKKKITTPDDLPETKTKVASPPVLTAYAVKKKSFDKSMDKDLSTWTILFKRYVSIFKKDPESGLKFFHGVPTQKALYGPLYEFAKKHSSAASLTYLDSRLEFLKAGATTASKNKLKLNKKSLATATASAKAKLKDKKKGSGNIFTNMFNDVFGPSNPKGSLAAVQYAKQASQYGVPGSNPLGVNYNGNTPQVNLLMAKNMRKSKSKIISEIKSVCSKHGFDSGYLLYVTAMESGLNPNAKNPYATASGLYQYIDSTWSGKMQQYAAQYKIPYSASPFDIKYSTIIAGASANADASYLSSLKPVVYYIDLYMIHFLGQGGATKFFRYLKEAPNTSGVEAFGMQDASENQPYFYNNNSPLSIKGMYEKIASLMTYRSKQFGLNSQSFDIYGEHGKVGKQKKTIAAQTKTKAAAAIHKGLGKKTPKGAVKPTAPGTAMVAAHPGKKAPAPTAVAKKHVATPSLTDVSDAHQAFNKRHANKNVTETATVANHHLGDISEHNREMKMILKQQLTVQTQTLAYLKNISQSMSKNTATKVSSNAPLPAIKTEPVVRPHAPRPAVHVGPRTASLKAANAVLE